RGRRGALRVRRANARHAAKLRRRAAGRTLGRTRRVPADELGRARDAAQGDPPRAAPRDSPLGADRDAPSPARGHRRLSRLDPEPGHGRRDRAGRDEAVSVLPDADALFLRFFDRWYSESDRRRKGFRATRPDLLLDSALV